MAEVLIQMSSRLSYPILGPATRRLASLRNGAGRVQPALVDGGMASCIPRLVNDPSSVHADLACEGSIERRVSAEKIFRRRIELGRAHPNWAARAPVRDGYDVGAEEIQLFEQIEVRRNHARRDKLKANLSFTNDGVLPLTTI